MGYINIELDRKAQLQLESNYNYIATVLSTTQAKKIFRRSFAKVLKPTRSLARTITRRGRRPLGLNRLKKGGPKIKRTKRAFQIIRIRQIRKKLVGARIGFIGSKEAGIRYPQLLGIEHGNVKFKPANRPIQQAVNLTIRSRTVLVEMTDAINQILIKKKAKRIQ